MKHKLWILALASVAIMALASFHPIMARTFVSRAGNSVDVNAEFNAYGGSVYVSAQGAGVGLSYSSGGITWTSGVNCWKVDHIVTTVTARNSAGVVIYKTTQTKTTTVNAGTGSQTIYLPKGCASVTITGHVIFKIWLTSVTPFWFLFMYPRWYYNDVAFSTYK